MRVYRPRRYFKITEINLMRQWASEGKSQNEVGLLLDRDPGVIAQAGIRYDIKFHAKPGPKKIRTAEEIRKQRAESCFRYRQKRGAKKRIFRVPRTMVMRFDDPRVMI